MSDRDAHPLLAEIAERLARGNTADASLQAALDRTLDWFGCAAGTIHDFDARAGVLRLRAQHNIPDAVRERVRLVPVGKGMAGLAAQRRVSVQVCNLQADLAGAAEPAARATGMEGCIAVPILAGDALCGVLGVAKPAAHTYGDHETELLLGVAAALAAFLGRDPAGAGDGRPAEVTVTRGMVIPPGPG
jgi:GAF domain-containing protein